jgi:hypothetical protein
MFTHNSAMYGTKILGEIVIDIIYFPLWWYTRGLVRLVFFLEKFIINRERSLAFLVWVKNIHRPMYGQYDWQGRLISFFMRLFQIIVRGIVLVFWLIFALALFLIWIALPFLIFYEIYFQLI